MSAWNERFPLTVASGATTLNDLTDVTLTAVSNNQILVYNNSTGQWS